MKKIYTTPTANEIKIATCDIIATSVGIYNNNDGGDDTEGGYDPSNSLVNSRRGSWGNLWD